MGKHHEWHERLDDGDTRSVRAHLFGGRWSFQVRLKSAGRGWEELPEPELDDLHELRDQLQKKYTRGRVPFEQLARLDALIERRESR